MSYGSTTYSLESYSADWESGHTLYGNYFINVGVSGHIWKFDVDSQIWSQKTSGTSETLLCVHGTEDGAYIVACGTNGTVLYTLNGGETWGTLGTFPTSDTLTGCWVLDVDEVWIVGRDGAGTGKAWVWDGSTWTQSTSQPYGNWNGIVALSSSDIYVVSNIYGTRGLWHYNGSTWTNETTEPSDPQESICQDTITSSLYIHSASGGGFNRLRYGSFGSWNIEHSDAYTHAAEEGRSLWIDEVGKVWMCGADGADAVVRSWDGAILADEYVKGSTTGFTGIHGRDESSIMITGVASGGNNINTYYYNGTSWSQVILSGGADMNCVWAPGLAAAGALSNPSFEIAGEEEGLASTWEIAYDLGAQNIGSFEGSIAPYEQFESGWQGGNQLSAEEFDAVDLSSATFNDSTAEVENFDYEWKRPITEMSILFSNAGRTAPAYANPNDAFTVGALYRDLDTGGRAVALEKQGVNTIQFTYVDFVQPIEISDAGFAYGPPPPPSANSGHIIADLAFGYKLIGEGDGADKTFAVTTEPYVHPKQTSRQATFHITAVIGSITVHVYDDGLGELVGDALDSTAVSSINYVTGYVSVSFSTAPDADTKIEAWFDYGVVRTGRVSENDDPNPFISSVTKLEPSLGSNIPPYNHSSIMEFQPGDLAEAEFGGIQQAEKFESGWDLPLNSGGDCTNSIIEFTSSDITAGTFNTTLDNYEDFEQEWNVSFGGNETAQSSFFPSDLDAGTFDSGVNAYEDFEGSWITQAQV